MLVKTNTPAERIAAMGVLVALGYTFKGITFHSAKEAEETWPWVGHPYVAGEDDGSLGVVSIVQYEWWWRDKRDCFSFNEFMETNSYVEDLRDSKIELAGDHTAVVNRKGAKVDCTFFPAAQIFAVADAVRKAQGLTPIYM